jgi:CHAD domain-containing protein
MSMFDSILGQVLTAEAELYRACSRLRAGTDDEALHDLRIQLRRLRSLLRPLRTINAVARLDDSVAQLARLTSPVRDLEVLLGELERTGHAESAASRRDNLLAAYRQVLQSDELATLFAELDAWPGSFQFERLSGHTHKLKKRVRQRLNKQIRRLTDALANQHFDRHELRVLTKRTRYMLDAYPRQASVAKAVIASLKALQSALGTWHDLHQWCLKADAEPDLRPLFADWQQGSESALLDAEAEIVRLRTLLDA